MERFSPDVLEMAWRALNFLESIDWKWDLNTLFAQPDELLDAVMSIRSVAEAFREQQRNKNKASAK